MSQEKQAKSLDKVNDFYVVGIGASAGGYEALQTFFSNMPPDSGMAFVVVQHLSPDYKSLMVELLSRHTEMKVYRVEDSVRISPNCIYLIPPRKAMSIFKNQLFLTEINQEHGLSLLINTFFRSLAEDKQSKAIGIILSGTGSDGTLGIREIKGMGGMVMVQDTTSAKFDGMPKSAIATGLVDYILPTEGMPETLLNYINQLHVTQQQVGEAIMHGENVNGLSRILYLIKQEKNFDFTYYKPSTIVRRIEKRMGINQIDNLTNYVDYLEKYPAEISILAEELLINVTKFFRDSESFEYLKAEILPQIFESRVQNRPIRVWVTACSTGEEAYSLAIIFREYVEMLGEDIEVKVFATDIDKTSLERASQGIYSESIIADVSRERLTKYFTRRGNAFQVNDALRKMVIFAQQNILIDAPFNKIDLVTCRNLLIYFQSEAQKRTLSYIHYALNKDRFLFLGKSETVGEMSQYFQTLDNHWKIYRKVGQHTLPLIERQNLFRSSTQLANFQPKHEEQTSTVLPHNKFETIYRILMEDYEPSAILVNRANEAIYYFGDVSLYFKPPRGKVEMNVTKVLREELAIAVGTALHKVRKTGEKIAYRDILLNHQGQVTKINLIVKAVFEEQATHDLLFIIFEPKLGRVDVETDEAELYDPKSQASLRIQDLENELQLSKENLQATVEELETSNEELQATNEELLASNEELQSTNEELQSVNEELITVNAEYQHKLEELIDMTSDFDNLLESTQIATLFLDADLKIRKFTPHVAEVMNVVQTDIGRPISHFSHKLKYEKLLEDIKTVLNTEEIIVRELESKDNQWYHLRILPYMASDNVLDGVTITLIDVTDRVEAERALQRTKEALEEQVQERTQELQKAKEQLLVREKRLTEAIDMARLGKWSWDIESNQVWLSGVACSLFGLAPKETELPYKEFLDYVYPDDRDFLERRLQKALEEKSLSIHYQIVPIDETVKTVHVEGKVFGEQQDNSLHILGTIQDITDWDWNQDRE